MTASVVLQSAVTPVNVCKVGAAEVDFVVRDVDGVVDIRRVVELLHSAAQNNNTQVNNAAYSSRFNLFA